jgi:hypothetical protein
MSVYRATRLVTSYVDGIGPVWGSKHPRYESKRRKRVPLLSMRKTQSMPSLQRLPLDLKILREVLDTRSKRGNNTLDHLEGDIADLADSKNEYIDINKIQVGF